MQLFTVHPLTYPLLIAVAIAGVLGAFAWRQATPASREFAWLTVSVALWSLGYAVELQQSSLSRALFWVGVEYLSISAAPVLLFLFAAAYTDSVSFVRSRRGALLFAIPTTVAFLVWTNPWHGLHYIDPRLITVDGFTLLTFEPGPSYWLNVVYSYVMIGATIALLVRTFAASAALYRRQIGTVLAGVLVPWIGNAFYLFLMRPASTVDVTPITFTVSCGLMALGMFRYGFLDLAPVARNKLVETTRDAWIVLDTRGRLVDLNATARQILGDPDHPMLGIRLAEALAPGHPLLSCVPLEDRQHAEIALLNDAGETRAYDVQLSLLTDRRRLDSGRLLVLHDITERKAAETSLRELNKRLESTVALRTAEIRVEKEKVEAILTSVKEGIVLISADLTIAYANAGMLALVGLTAADLLGHSLATAPIWDVAPQWAPLQVALANRERWETEVSLRDQRGQVRQCALYAAPVSENAGLNQGCIATFRDISQAKQLDTARSQFISAISHELRTPITTLKLYLDLLERVADDEKRHRFMTILSGQTDRLEELAGSVVDLARLDSSYGLGEWREIPLGAVIASAVKTVQPSLWRRGLQTDAANTQVSDGALLGDAALIQRALVELLKNAATFAPEGSAIEITTAARPTMNGTPWITVTVRDQGPGIAPDEREKVFERFFRGEAVSSSTVPGFGLGLSVVREIMKVHHGRVTLEATEDHGNAFTLWFPAGGSAYAALIEQAPGTQRMATVDA